MLFKQIDKLFQTCSFGSIKGTLPIDFMGISSTQSHLDDIFDFIVKNSELYNLPDKKGVPWNDLRKLMSKEDLEILNHYRKKFGKPEA